MIEFLLNDVIWRNALAVIPLALIAAVACRLLPCRPTTRHAVWAIVLISLVVPPVLPQAFAFARLPLYAYPHLAQAAYRATLTANADAPRPGELQTEIRQPLRDHVPSDLAAWLSEPRFDYEIQVVGPPSEVATPDRLAAPDGVDRVSNPDHRGAIASTSRSLEAEASFSSLQVSSDLFGSSTQRSGSAALTTSQEYSTPVSSAPSRHVESFYGDRERAGTGAADSSSHVQSIPQQSGIDHLSADGASPNMANASHTEMPGDRNRVATSTWLNDAWSGLGVWLVWIQRVRDAIAAIPPPPIVVWLGGLILLLIALVMKSGRYRKIIRIAPAAPFDVRLLTQRIAREMELRRVPDVRMTDACLAPMIWCGIRPRLILPRRLWSELDVVGRRTVICHELAHLKRRDHWICRVDLLVGLLYWWHPLVWWIRRQVREQAEYCCDSWVTSLLPDGRRAYAHALLQTRSFTAGVHPAPNALALAVAAPRARRFARRLAMVMTHRHRPGMTLHGVLLVCTLGVIGYVAAPMVACPPDEKKQDKSPEPNVVEISGALSDRAEPTVNDDDDGLTTFEQFMLQQENGSAPDPDEETQEDIQSIEERIERLQERIGELLESIDGPAPESGLTFRIPEIPELNIDHMYQDVLRRALEGHVVIEYDDCTPSRSRRIRVLHDNCTPSRARRVTRERDDCTPSRAHRIRVHDNCTPSRGQALSFTVAPSDPGEVTVRSYSLSRGKLKDLTRLMARSDVPIYINRHQERIDVHGTPAQHRVFAAFVELIDSGNVESDVIGDAVNLAYVNALQAQQGRGCSVNNVESVERQFHVYQQQSRMFREQSHQIERYVEQLREQADRVREQARQLRSQYDRQRQDLREVEERARSLNDLARFELMNEANVLLASAHAIQGETFRLDTHAQMLENQAEAFESQAENAVDQSDRFRDLAVELRDLADTYRDRQGDRAGYAGE